MRSWELLCVLRFYYSEPVLNGLRNKHYTNGHIIEIKPDLWTRLVCNVPPLCSDPKS